MDYIIGGKKVNVVQDMDSLLSFDFELEGLLEVEYQDLYEASNRDELELVFDFKKGIYLLVIFYQLFDVSMGSQLDCNSYQICILF